MYKLAQGLQNSGAKVWVLHPGPQKILGVNSPSFIKFFGIESLPFISKFPYSNAINNYLHPINPVLIGKLERIIKNHRIDVIQGEQPWSIFPSILEKKFRGIPFVLDEHNIELLASRTVGSIPFAWPYTFSLEHYAIHNSNGVIVVSEIDERRLSEFYTVPRDKIVLVPNGVDIKKFEITESNTNLKLRLGFAPDEQIVLFHGLMGWRPNIEAASVIISYIAPMLESKLPKVRFVIIGKGSHRFYNIARNKNITIKEFVPEISDYVKAADLCIVPLKKGTGTRLKILEYLAGGKPLVSTIIGAEGLPIQSGKEAILCQNVNEEFVESIWYLLTNSSVASEMGVKAKKLALHYDWEKLSRKLVKFYERTISCMV